LNPVDGKNMNRTYPGSKDGTQSERASLAITKQVVEQSDHLIDFHGGDLDESLRPYSYWSKTGREPQDRISREMVLAGLDHIMFRQGDPGRECFSSGEYGVDPGETVDHRGGRSCGDSDAGGRRSARSRHALRHEVPEDAAGRTDPRREPGLDRYPS
jgi:hypothetical protein